MMQPRKVSSTISVYELHIPVLTAERKFGTRGLEDNACFLFDSRHPFFEPSALWMWWIAKFKSLTNLKKAVNSSSFMTSEHFESLSSQIFVQLSQGTTVCLQVAQVRESVETNAWILKHESNVRHQVVQCMPCPSQKNWSWIALLVSGVTYQASSSIFISMFSFLILFHYSETSFERFKVCAQKKLPCKRGFSRVAKFH